MNEEIIDLIEEKPNNSILGSKIRKTFKVISITDIEGVHRFIDISKEYPNDESLGEAIRSYKKLINIILLYHDVV